MRWFSYVAGALAVSAPFAVYLATAAPFLTFEDAGELITAAAALGVPHPSGYPVFALWGHLFTLLPVSGYAWRVNCAAAAAGALSCGVVFLIVRRLGNSRGVGADVAGLAAAAWWGVSSTLWSQSVVTEVYTPAILAAALAFYAAFNYVRGGDVRFCYAMAFACGVTAAAHPFYLFLAAVAAAYALIAGRRLPRPGGWLAAAAALGGTSVYLYLPLRAAQAPLLNWGNARTAGAFVAHVARRMYGGPDLSRLPFVGDHWRELGALAWREFGPAAVLVAAAGFVAGWRKDKKLWGALGVAALLTGPIATVALTLSLHTHQLVGIEVWYLPFFLVVAVAAGGAFSSGCTSGKFVIRLGAYGAAAALPLFAFYSNLPHNNYRSYTYAADFGGDFLRTLGYRGQNIMFEGSSLGVFEAAYYKKVEGKRPDHTFWDVTGRVFAPAPIGAWDDVVEESLLSAGRPTYYNVLRAAPICYGYSLEPAGLLFRAFLVPFERSGLSPVWGRYVWKDAVRGEMPDGARWRSDPAARAAWVKYRVMWASDSFVAGDRTAALSALGGARSVAAGLPEELGEIAVTYMVMGEAARAAAVFGEAADAVPRRGRGDVANRVRYAGFKNNQAMALLATGDVEGAAASLAASLAAYPDQPEIRRLAQLDELARKAKAMKGERP